MMRNRGRRPWLGLAVLAVAVIVAAASRYLWADGDADRWLARYDPATAAALAQPDSLPLARRVGEIGAESAISLYESLRDQLAAGDEPTREVVTTAMGRLADILAVHYLLPEFRRDTGFWLTAPPTVAGALAARLVTMDATFADGALDAVAVRDTLLDDLARFEAAGYPLGVVRAENYLATNALKRGQGDESRAWSRRYLDDARRWDLRAAACEAHCFLAMHGVAESSADVSRHLEEALTIARESRLAGLAGRVHAIAGIHAHEQGRFAAECDHFEEAVLVCRELGQAARGLPQMVFLMQFYAAFGDWNRVEELAPRADALAAEARGLAAAGLWREPVKLERDLLRLDELRARTLVARGRIAEAQALYLELLAATRRSPLGDTAYVLDRRCRGLLEAGEGAPALAAAREALAYAAEVPLQEWAIRYRLYEAGALLACSDTLAAALSLAIYDSTSVAHPVWVDDLRPKAVALRARVVQQWPDSAVTVLAAGLNDLVRSLGASDASARAYLELARADDLRLALHRHLAHAPHLGYGLELLWRRLPGWLGDDRAATPPSGEELTARARQLAALAQARLARDGAVHCLFSTHADRVLRWTATAGAVRCDTLPATREMLANQVAGALALLAVDTTASVGPELAARLRDLAEDLLPPECASGAPPRLLYVSADGELALLPPGVLNLATPPAYEPLSAVCDVVSMRASGASPRLDRPVSSLVIAAPEIAPRLRRLYPGLGELAGGTLEAQRVRKLLPGGRLLAGPDATRDAVVAGWQEVGCLYFAGHAVRSPESPYRTFLPLSSASREAGLTDDGGRLDVADIRAADLTRVQLVVLSGCASGAPYVSGVATAPSLGDVFLDAGADAVVQTLWRVRDDASPRLLEDLLAAWLHDDVALPAAFGRAQRAALRGKNGAVVHPFGWAAYSLNLRSLE